MKKVFFFLICAIMVGGVAAATEVAPLAEEKGVAADATLSETPVAIPDVAKPIEIAFDVEGTEITETGELEAILGARIIRDDPGESIAYSRGETDSRNGLSDRDVAERVAKYLDQRTTTSISVSVGWSSPGIKVGYDIYPDISPSITVSGGLFSIKFTIRDR